MGGRGGGGLFRACGYSCGRGGKGGGLSPSFFSASSFSPSPVIALSISVNIRSKDSTELWNLLSVAVLCDLEKPGIGLELPVVK